jgi:hypothetical protein
MSDISRLVLSMIISISWESVDNISRSWVEVLIFCACICHGAISQWIREQVCIKFVQISEKVQRIPWQLSVRGRKH